MNWGDIIFHIELYLHLKCFIRNYSIPGKRGHWRASKDISLPYLTLPYLTLLVCAITNYLSAMHVWSDGREVELQYSYWACGRPLTHAADCVLFSQIDDVWRSWPCTDPQNFVCQSYIRPPTTTSVRPSPADVVPPTSTTVAATSTETDKCPVQICHAQSNGKCSASLLS